MLHSIKNNFLNHHIYEGNFDSFFERISDLTFINIFITHAKKHSVTFHLDDRFIKENILRFYFESNSKIMYVDITFENGLYFFEGLIIDVASYCEINNWMAPIDYETLSSFNISLLNYDNENIFIHNYIEVSTRNFYNTIYSFLYSFSQKFCEKNEFYIFCLNGDNLKIRKLFQIQSINIDDRYLNNINEMIDIDVEKDLNLKFKLQSIKNTFFSDSILSRVDLQKNTLNLTNPFEQDFLHSDKFNIYLNLLEKKYKDERNYEFLKKVCLISEIKQKQSFFYRIFWGWIFQYGYEEKPLKIFLKTFFIYFLWFIIILFFNLFINLDTVIYLKSMDWFSIILSSFFIQIKYETSKNFSFFVLTSQMYWTLITILWGCNLKKIYSRFDK